MKFKLIIFAIVLALNASGQKVSVNLAAAINSLEKDEQFAHSILSMYVVETGTGNVVYEHNAQTGMAPASCQKVITSASAFELLGKDYRYKTYIGYDNLITNGTLKGNLFFAASGDPTLGSWRWNETKQEIIFKKLLATLNKKGIKKIDGNIYINDLGFSYQPIPDGWIWQDIGNYYGAGAWPLNWHENQYDLNLKSGNEIGDRTEILSTEPIDLKNDITNLITTGRKGSGDNAYIYAAPYSKDIYATGTIPAGEKKFKISGAIPNPPMEFAKAVSSFLKSNSISFNGDLISYNTSVNNGTAVYKMTTYLDSIISPSFDSMNYWFLKKSVNLYGEAFVKTIAYNQQKNGSTDLGVSVIQDFWKSKGINPASLKIIDGSGLAPANRVTTIALVSILQYAKKQDWFASFYNALPEMNGIKMKDGYISGVRSYAGYVKSKTGTEYTFSFIVNNFDGSPGTVREKMWKVLDLLK